MSISRVGLGSDSSNPFGDHVDELRVLVLKSGSSLEGCLMRHLFRKRFTGQADVVEGAAGNACERPDSRASPFQRLVSHFRVATLGEQTSLRLC